VAVQALGGARVTAAWADHGQAVAGEVDRDARDAGGRHGDHDAALREHARTWRQEPQLDRLLVRAHIRKVSRAKPRQEVAVHTEGPSLHRRSRRAQHLCLHLDDLDHGHVVGAQIHHQQPSPAPTTGAREGDRAG